MTIGPMALLPVLDSAVENQFYFLKIHGQTFLRRFVRFTGYFRLRTDIGNQHNNSVATGNANETSVLLVRSKCSDILWPTTYF